MTALTARLGQGITFEDPYIENGYRFRRAITIPEIFTEIESKAFFDRDIIESVKITDGITKIGEEAFAKINNLRAIKFGSNVTTIGKRAFAESGRKDRDGWERRSSSYKSGRANIDFPESLEVIDDQAFYLSMINGSINIPSGVANVGDWAFSTNWIESVNLSDGVKEIGYAAFSRNNINSVIIPNSVTAIGSFAFSRNKIESVVIPNNLSDISSYTFAFNNITSVVIPNGVTAIGEGAFMGNKLTSVEIPESVTTIGEGAFVDNDIYFTEVELPAIFKDNPPYNAFDESVLFTFSDEVNTVTVPTPTTEPSNEIKKGVASIEFSEDPAVIRSEEKNVIATLIFGSDISNTAVAGIHFYSPNDNAKLFFSDIPIVDGKAIISIKLNEWAAAGEWRIAEVNTTTLEGKFEVEYENELIEKRINTRLLIENQNGDNEKAFVTSIESYQDSGNVVINVSFEDYLSGISSIGVQIKPRKGESKYFESVSAEDISNGMATFIITPESLNDFGIDVATGDFDGVWDILEVSAYDKAGNFSVYYTDELITQNLTTSFNYSSSSTPEPEPAPTSTPEPVNSLGNAPNLVSATLRGDQLVLQFDDVISDTLPRLSNFTLNNGNREFGFKDVEVVASAGQVKLIATKPFDSTSNVTLDYFGLASDQVNGVIQSESGVDLASFNGFQINNQTEQDNTLAIEDGDFEGNTITLELNAPLSSSIPSSKRFKVKAGRKKQRITDISTDAAEGIVTLTTKNSIGSYESIEVSYKDLRGDQTEGVIEDKAGNDMVTFRNYEIINGGYEEIPPKLIAAELDDNTLTMEFDSIINNNKLSKKRFKVKVNGKKLRVTSATVEDDYETFVNLTVQQKRNRPIDLQSEVTLTYTDPRGDQVKNVIEDVFGNDLPSFSGVLVDII